MLKFHELERIPLFDMKSNNCSKTTSYLIIFNVLPLRCTFRVIMQIEYEDFKIIQRSCFLIIESWIFSCYIDANSLFLFILRITYYRYLIYVTLAFLVLFSTESSNFNGFCTVNVCYMTVKITQIWNEKKKEFLIKWTHCHIFLHWYGNFTKKTPIITE